MGNTFWAPSCQPELYHHGIKGQKWGVRRYQNYDGTRTKAGKLRYGPKITDMKSVIKQLPNMTLSEAKAYTETYLLGKNTVDNYIKAGVTLSRIQSSENFEPYAFYATYKKHDNDFYTGLFGSNLINRANAAAKYAEKNAKTDEEKVKATELRKNADELKVNKLSIAATKNLKVPSDKNAADTLHKLMADNAFKADVATSIVDAKSQMRRPSQQMLLSRAERVLQKKGKLTESDKKTLYEAFNLTLTFHNDYNNRAQDTFYNNLKQKGYNAIVDVNDQKYSSYHAKRPMIVFDHDAVSLNSIDRLDNKTIAKYEKRAKNERRIREALEQTFGSTSKAVRFGKEDIESYLQDNFRRSGN